MKLSRSKKGQISIEYLTIYGWMLIIVLAMIGVLFYFDVFDMERYSAQYCRFDTNFVCNEFSVQEVESGVFNVIILLQNNMNKEIKIQKLDLVNANDQTIICEEAQIHCPWYENAPAVESVPSTFTGMVVRNESLEKQWNPTRVCLFGLINCTDSGAKIRSKQTIKFNMEFSALDENASNHTTTGIVHANIVGLSSGIIIPVVTCGLGAYNQESGEFIVEDSASTNLFQLDSNGMIVVNSLVEGSTGIPDANDFIIQNSTGSPIAWVTNPGGVLHLTGILEEETSQIPDPAEAEFIIQNSFGEDIAFIDEDGNMFILSCIKTSG